MLKNKFDDKDVRRLFIRKVFAILSIQLLLTFSVVTVFTLVHSVKHYIQHHPEINYASYALFIVLYMTLVCFDSVRRKHPLNLILLVLFTIVLSYMTGTLASYYNTKSVMCALGITVGVCSIVIIYSLQTKHDFTVYIGLLIAVGAVLAIFGIITFFTFWFDWYMEFVDGALAALVFCLFLAYETQLLLGNKKHEINPEEYVYGALTIYVDVVLVFTLLLLVCGKR